MTHEVGNAIVRYLQEVRPGCGRREVFLTFKAPFRPLSAGGLYHLTRSRFDRLDVQTPHRGPHALRHACACHLLAEGFSLEAISDHLGLRRHRCDHWRTDYDCVCLNYRINLQAKWRAIRQ